MNFSQKKSRIRSSVVLSSRPSEHYNVMILLPRYTNHLNDVISIAFPASLRAPLTWIISSCRSKFIFASFVPPTSHMVPSSSLSAFPWETRSMAELHCTRPIAEAFPVGIYIVRSFFSSTATPSRQKKLSDERWLSIHVHSMAEINICACSMPIPSLVKDQSSCSKSDYSMCPFFIYCTDIPHRSQGWRLRISVCC